MSDQMRQLSDIKWQATGVDGHTHHTCGEWMYTSDAPPVEADEYERMKQRAEAAEARVVNWISTEERLPETQLRVLAVMLYDGRKPRIIRAMHIPAKTVECLDWEFNDAVVYDSESERHYLGAGWYELMEEGEYDYVGPLSDSVTHWAEMPELPEYFRQ